MNRIAGNRGSRLQEHVSRYYSHAWKDVLFINCTASNTLEPSSYTSDSNGWLAPPNSPQNVNI